MKLNNPFVIAGYKGSEYFCDRVAETQKLCDAIRNESHVTLLSPRRYGKTGLIRHAFERLEEDGYETIYLDIFGTQNLAEFTNALAQAVIGRLDTPLEKVGGAAKRLIQMVRPTLSYDEQSGSPQLSVTLSAEQVPATLDEIFAYLKQHDVRTVVAIDEFQQIREYPEKGVEALLRSHVQFSSAQFIFAGSKQHLMREMFTSPKMPFYQSTLMMPLDVIGEQPYFEFAERFFEAVGRSLSHEVFHALYERFDGITWYMQTILWDFYASGEDITSVAQLETSVANRVAANEYNQQQLLEILPDGARRLLRAVARERFVKEPQSGEFVAKHGLRAASSVKTSLQMLLDKQLLYRDDRGYVVYDRFLAEYLRNLEERS